MFLKLYNTFWLLSIGAVSSVSLLLQSLITAKRTALKGYRITKVAMNIFTWLNISLPQLQTFRDF